MGNDARQRAWTYRGAQGERLLLLALAEHIPDGKHTCWPAVETLAGMIGVGDRQTQRIVRSLEDAGVIVVNVGRGRGHTTLYGLLIGLSPEEQARVRQVVKGDIAVSPNEPIKGDISGLKGDIKDDTAMSPFIEEKVTFPTEKVTSEVVKGDIAVSPEPKGNEIRNEKSVGESLETPSRTPALEELARAIAKTCRINPKIATKKQRDGLNYAYSTLRAIEATATDVEAREVWWYENDWRAKKENRPPRPEELVEVWEVAGSTPNGQKHTRNGTGPPIRVTKPNIPDDVLPPDKFAELVRNSRKPNNTS